MSLILVTYATRYQATAEIAHTIAEVLMRDGTLSVHVLPANEVMSLAAYSAVVLGSAVYMGQWQPEAMEFLNTFEADLTRLPVWMFSSGPTGEGDVRDLLNGWQLPDVVRLFAERIQPRGVVVFHGRLDTGQLNILERAFVQAAHAPAGDFRDWTEIRAWAESIQTALRSGHAGNDS